MFDDFNWKELLMSIDALIRNEKYGSYIELTSNPTRIEAHGLYQKLGFNIRKTNVYRKEII